SPTLYITLAGILLLIWFTRHQIKASGIAKKVTDLINQFAEGFKSIRNIKNKGAFIFHSLFIWFLYYLMLYCVFFSFEFTSHLSALAGLTVFVLGSFGMVAPVQGGIGPWHFMVYEALALYGVDKADGKIFALVAHGSTTVMLVVFGLIALIVLPFINERSDREVKITEKA
ncbi:MAG: flippase-like domain-containing protein, partial [Verrucomicrobia bacterium]|nr:flippase-like domain-containing protein [Prolixibacteraceae bacterium]